MMDKIRLCSHELLEKRDELITLMNKWTDGVNELDTQ